jgi:hypothetical protein
MFAMLASGSVVFDLGCVDLIGPAVGPVGADARDEGNRMTAPQSSKCRARQGAALIAETPWEKIFRDRGIFGGDRAA